MLALLLPLLGPVIDRLVSAIPDPAEREREKNRLLSEMQQQAQQLNLAQIEVNKAEAATGNLFIGGWRPAVGWVCALALAWSFVVGPAAQWILTVTGHGANLPPTGMNLDLWELVFAMLGLGGLRTYEKKFGIAAGTPAQASRPGTTADDLNAAQLRTLAVRQ